MIKNQKVDFEVTLPSERKIVITRMFDAPRGLVFQALTDPKLIPEWWGPRRLTTAVDKMDVRPGGAWRFIQHDAEGNEFAFNGEYREIVPPERVVSTFEFEGMPGHIVTDTMTLEDHGGKTKLTVTSLFATREDRDGMLSSGMETGARESYERLAELLAQPGKLAHELAITRVFDAPVEAVWKAWTDPDQVMRWWGPSYFTSPMCKIDLRVGGKALVAMRSPDGHDTYSVWSYQKIVPMERIEFIQNLADKDGNKVDPAKMGMPPDFPQDVRTVVTFKAVGKGQTEMTVTEYLPATSMIGFAEAGLKQSLDKLADSLH